MGRRRIGSRRGRSVGGEGLQGVGPKLARRMSRPRLLAASLALNLVLALLALGWLAWVVTQPRHWFPGAYAQQGERGERGPRGPVGLPGPPGSVGPDASDAIDELSSRVDDLETGSGDDASSSVDDLVSRLDDLETGGGDQAGMSIDDLATTLGSMCDTLGTYGGALQDIYLAAC